MRGRATATRVHAAEGPAVPQQPAHGRGGPRTQVELRSLGSGCPLQETTSQPAAGPRRSSVPGLSAAELAALRQLADAPASVVARWPVGRVVAQALIRRDLVHACSEWVWLTAAGQQALADAGR